MDMLFFTYNFSSFNRNFQFLFFIIFCWSISKYFIDLYFDDTDTSGQVSLTIGSSFTMNLGPEGSGSGSYKLSGTGIVTEKTITATHDGLVEMTIAFQGTGALTIGTYS